MVDLSKPVKLENQPLKVGQIAPNFSLAKMDGLCIVDVSLKEFKNKIKVISCFPSIDTGICDLQTKWFFKHFANHEKITLINVSADLMFAQNRWCSNNNATNVIMLSDYKTHQFAKDYGVNIVGANLIFRSVFVLDENNIIKYIQLTKIVKEELDYAKIKVAVDHLLNA